LGRSADRLTLAVRCLVRHFSGKIAEKCCIHAGNWLSRCLVIGMCEVVGPHAPSVFDKFPEPPNVDLGQSKHHEWRTLVTGRREEDVRLALQQGLSFGFVADEEHGDVRSNDPRFASCALGIGPDESPPADPKIEALARDLRDIWKCEREATNIVCVGHGTRLSDPAEIHYVEGLADFDAATAGQNWTTGYELGGGVMVIRAQDAASSNRIGAPPEEEGPSDAIVTAWPMGWPASIRAGPTYASQTSQAAMILAPSSSFSGIPPPWYASK
jgi:hypothetical protein